MTQTWLDAVLVLLRHGWVEQPPRLYLQSRGIDPATVGDKYQLGYCSREVASALGSITVGQTALPPDFLKWAKHALPDRLVFPMLHPLGFCIGLQARSLDPNTPANNRYLTYLPPMYKDVYPQMFGAHRACRAAWQTRRLVVVEGPMDALACAQATDDVIATLTASVSTAHRAFFGRWATTVIALFDMDESGRRAAAKVTAAGAQYGYTVSTPGYPAHDPHELWTQRPDLLRRLVGRTELDQILALLKPAGA